MPTLFYHRLWLAGCLLVFFWLGIEAALAKNPTADEPVHLTRGVALWQGLDFRFQQEHTPLSHWIIGLLPALEGDLPPIDTLAGWSTGDRLAGARALVWERGLDVTRLFFLGRLGILWLGLLAGALLARWVTERAGRFGGAAAALLFAFDPNLLAHAALATTDFTATATFLAAVYGFSRLARARSLPAGILAGVLLGLGLAAKMTGLLLLPLGLLILFLGRFRARLAPEESGRAGLFQMAWRAGLDFALLLPVAGLVVWLIYRFSFGPAAVPPLGLTLPLPAPAYWGSLFRVNAHIEGGHRAFFLGEIGSEGWWSYFLVAFLVKTPLATLLLLLAAAGLTARRRRWLADLPFWLPAGLLLAFASYSRLNIGYRHILPALPLLIGWIGVTAGCLDPAGIWRRQRRTARPLLTLFLVAVIAPTLAVRPSYLAFFNRAVGGPAGGFRLLGDSNLDWGQDWKGAAAYARGQELTATYMLPFGFVDPAYYGLAAESLITADGWAIPSFAPANPAAGTYLLSVNALQGMLADSDLLDWFRRRTPSEMRATGYSIYVYEVESPAAGSWVAHCVDPGPRLTPDEAEQLLGIGEVRHVFFDCRSGWVFPQNGAPGWYILPPKDSAWWLQGELGTSLAEIYAHRATFDLPEFEVVYWDGRRDPADAIAIPAPPVPEEGPAVLVGGWAGDTAWRTVWRVRRPTDRPLSVLGHRFDRSGQPAGVADGLVYATSHWEAGDLFVQVHEFDDPTPPFELETGLYDYVTEEREGPTSRLRAGGQ